jgi:hypothetical protein
MRIDMIRRLPSLFAIAATTIVSVMGPCSSLAQDGPRLAQKTLYTSDINYDATRSPDNKSLAVVLDNFAVTLVAGDGAAPTAIRVFPLSVPVTQAGNGSTVRIRMRGKLVCLDGAACVVIAWMNGYTNVLNISPSTPSGEFSTDADFSLPGADVHQAAVILIAERQAKKNDVTAMIKVDSLDLTIAPPAVASGTKK